MERTKVAKQVIVMRTDLGMRKGKMIAQGAHASIAFLTNKITTSNFKLTAFPKAKLVQLSKEEEAWVEGRFTKICVRVSSEEELLEIHQSALKAKLTSHLITDAGLTEFNGVPTKTCCAIGPNWSDAIDEITGKLVLL